MLTLTSPTLLAPAILIALLAAWASLSAAKKPLRISSTLLWKNLAPDSAPRPRRIDPPWLLLALATILAALALPQPTWFPRTPTPPAPAWNIRQLPNTPAQAFLPNLQNAFIDNTPTTSPLTTLPDSDTHTLSLRSPNNTLLASQTFHRPLLTPFRLLAVGQSDPALRRVLALQLPRTPPDDPDLPTLTLSQSPSFNPATSTSPLIIAIGPANLPGLSTAAPITAPPGAPFPLTAVNLPPDVHLPTTPPPIATTLTPATLSPDWHILISASPNKLPFLATRQLGPTTPPRTLVWLAAAPASQTNWPNDPSFVIFFTHLTRTTFNQPNTPLDYLPDPLQLPTTTPIPLHPYLLLLAALAFATALSLLLTRTR